MFSECSPCLLEQHISYSTAQQPVELLEKNLQNLFHSLTPQTVHCSAIHLVSPHPNLLLFSHGAQGSPPRRSSRGGSGRRGVVLAAGRSGGLNVGEPVGLVVGVARLARAHEGGPPQRGGRSGEGRH